MEDARTVAKVTSQLSATQESVEESDHEIERLHAAAAKANKTQLGLIRANHVLELKLLRMEESRNEAVKELYNQRIVENPPFWEEHIENLERETSKLRDQEQKQEKKSAALQAENDAMKEETRDLRSRSRTLAASEQRAVEELSRLKRALKMKVAGK